MKNGGRNEYKKGSIFPASETQKDTTAKQISSKESPTVATSYTRSRRNKSFTSLAIMRFATFALAVLPAVLAMPASPIIVSDPEFNRPGPGGPGQGHPTTVSQLLELSVATSPPVSRSIRYSAESRSSQNKCSRSIQGSNFEEAIADFKFS